MRQVMEIRGDLRDTVDDLQEHVQVCFVRRKFECIRVDMHRREISEYILEQDVQVRAHLIAILRGVLRDVVK